MNKINYTIFFCCKLNDSFQFFSITIPFSRQTEKKKKALIAFVVVLYKGVEALQRLFPSSLHRFIKKKKKIERKVKVDLGEAKKKARWTTKDDLLVCS